jgi:G6PDH family F420-dependent oxidoreductase
MTSFGYTLSSEEHDPSTLLRNATKAEELGFDFVSVSDHYHPWVSEQGHSPFVWSVLGGIAARTDRNEIGVGVTCPILRVHPVIAAHAAATASQLFDGRFFLGVGTGEALNEHVTGDRWPRPELRLQMLEEAVHVMRSLWTGETFDHVGRFYEVENARIFDPPPSPIPVIVSGFGTQAAELAGRIGDGYWGHAPDTETMAAFERSGGSGPRYAQLNLCWAEHVDAARETVYRGWPNGAVPGQLSRICRPGPTSSRRPSSRRSTTWWRRRRVGPTSPARSATACGSSSTPATTTCTSTRSAATNTGSSSSGSASSAPRSSNSPALALVDARRHIGLLVSASPCSSTRSPRRSASTAFCQSPPYLSSNALNSAVS